MVPSGVKLSGSFQVTLVNKSFNTFSDLSITLNILKVSAIIKVFWL